jgi:hypothetical protein
MASLQGLTLALTPDAKNPIVLAPLLWVLAWTLARSSFVFSKSQPMSGMFSLSRLWNERQAVKLDFLPSWSQCRIVTVLRCWDLPKEEDGVACLRINYVQPLFGSATPTSMYW